MGECLNELDLERLHDGGLSADESRRASAHLGSCDTCRERHRKFLDDQELLRSFRAAAREAPPASAHAFLEAIAGYQIGREIERGGQGIVFEAVQLGTRRTVALKVLREGALAGPRAPAIEAEIDTISALKHPNIVAIHDSGLVQGHFYYAMEYVDGLPLDEYARRTRPGFRPAASLLKSVCEAVGYAHQRGVIHRDLKPSNVRVDAAGVPHLLDFGLARRVEGVAAPALTASAEFAGTLSHAAPEQVGGGTREIDTRTDVYALGVTMYQVLTGTFPYPVQGDFAEVIGHIVRTEPRRPTVAGRRLPGELEAIILKALRKRPQDRYQSAGELAEDLRRFLEGEPVEARRDSGVYLARKLVWRHRGKFAVAATVIVLAASMLAWNLLSIAAQRDRAESAKQAESSARRLAEQLSTLLEQMLASVDPRNHGADVTVRETLDEAGRSLDAGSLRGEPAIEAAMRATIGRTYTALGLYPEAAPHLEAALALRRSLPGDGDQLAVAESLNDLALLRANRNQLDEAGTMLREALAIRRAALGEAHVQVARSLRSLAKVLQAQGDRAGAEQLHRQALAMRRALLGERNADVAQSLVDLGQLFYVARDLDQSEQLLREAMGISREAHGDEAHPDVAEALDTLAAVLAARHDFAGAEAAWREALAIERQARGAEHPDSISMLNNLATVLHTAGKLDEAEPLYEEVLALRRRRLGEQHPMVAKAMNNLGMTHFAMERYPEAEAMLRQALDLDRARLGEAHPDLGGLLYNLGQVQAAQGDWPGAESSWRNALEIQRASLPQGNFRIAGTAGRLGECMSRLGRYQEAEPLLLESLAIVKAARGDSHDWTVTARKRLVDLYEAWGRPEQAAEYRGQLPAP